MLTQNLTPTQLATIGRSLAFRASIAQKAAELEAKRAAAAKPVVIAAQANAHQPIPPLPAIVWPVIPDEAIYATRAGCPPISIIVKVVARSYGVSKLDIMSPRRIANIVRPRQVIMFLAKALTLHSLPEIGRRLGNRDHTTVLHACRKMAALVERDLVLKVRIESLTSEIMEASHEAIAYSRARFAPQEDASASEDRGAQSPSGG